ncbi:hypothetical protein [Paraferrimonas sedimenticola]|uniref:Uncharacterized protein n=1 Tax=Paraferrimonas sedimenticola TaxID=375674 RepID=A0AA37RSU9_9GAMM|nr:hypothetical protein [Paraferrimonas sedimenticola]GLP95348.1 hypothetical protein GCM10007895_06540 [Paraferrimonas sedimenticola]
MTKQRFRHTAGLTWGEHLVGKASPIMQIAAEGVDATLDQVEALMNDQTRSRAEKSPMLIKLRDDALKRLTSNYESYSHQRKTEMDSLDNEYDRQFDTLMNRTDAMLTYQAVRDLETGEVKPETMADASVLEALTKLSPVITGVNPERLDGAKMLYTRNNNPELAERLETTYAQHGNAEGSFGMMRKAISDVANEVDVAALETRVEI